MPGACAHQLGKASEGYMVEHKKETFSVDTSYNFLIKTLK